MIAKLQWPMKCQNKHMQMAGKYIFFKTGLKSAEQKPSALQLKSTLKLGLSEVFNKTNIRFFVYLFLLKTPLSSILGFMKFGLTFTITFYEQLRQGLKVRKELFLNIISDVKLIEYFN